MANLKAIGFYSFLFGSLITQTHIAYILCSYLYDGNGLWVQQPIWIDDTTLKLYPKNRDRHNIKLWLKHIIIKLCLSPISFAAVAFVLFRRRVFLCKYVCMYFYTFSAGFSVFFFISFSFSWGFILLFCIYKEICFYGIFFHISMKSILCIERYTIVRDAGIDMCAWIRVLRVMNGGGVGITKCVTNIHSSNSKVLIMFDEFLWRRWWYQWKLWRFTMTKPISGD